VLRLGPLLWAAGITAAITLTTAPAGADLAPPDYASYHAQRAYRQALMALRLGETDAALRTASEAVALTPEDPQALYLLGICQLFDEQYEQAGTTLERAIAIDPELPEAVHDLGLVRLHLGQGDEAAELFAFVSLMMPESWVGPYREAQTAALLRRDFDACEGHLREALRRGFPWLASLPVEPEWAAVAEDPAFVAMVGRLLEQPGG